MCKGVKYNFIDLLVYWLGKLLFKNKNLIQFLLYTHSKKKNEYTKINIFQ